MIWINAGGARYRQYRHHPLSRFGRTNMTIQRDTATKSGSLAATSLTAFDSVPLSYRVLIAVAIGVILVAITVASTTM
ncbi:MAG: hypothetical protein JWQ90_1285 [Hydrocarboniphaga sp.]|uniref:hypothetical protein n=1 Tax=Hydrocarboniphaga sp. TaxID=2033016 RepID=UPI00262225AC|nr:hypothetical protein [Hydrocarboniphaga sp.]MDB5968835.1 hypothetical protein [Hydrocarboniphaga sp.]